MQVSVGRHRKLAWVRKRADDPIESERRALIEQRQELAALQRQLAERVAAVRERETELRNAVAQASPAATSGDGSAHSVLPSLGAEGGRTDPGDRGRALDAREQALVAREEALAKRVARLGANPDDDTDESAIDAQRRLTELEARERALTEQLAAATERERALTTDLVALRAEAEARAALPPTPAEQTAAQAAKLETRVAELLAAEKAFERTREELTARSEAIAARERLIGEREREVSERADGWGANVELYELESRLRRLEHQKGPTQPAGFSSGVRKLEQQGKRGKPVS
jgi:DNA repair exonuclease SbcCD ATPase subunit